jgi:F-box and leucine-rich repeat protein 10/11
MLLLGLKQEVNFKRQITPQLNHAQLHRIAEHQSPKYNAYTPEPVTVPARPTYSPDAMHLDEPGPSVVHEKVHEAPTFAALNGLTAIHENGDASAQITSIRPPESSSSTLNVKKARRLKPDQIEKEVCAQCGKSEQRTGDDENSISWIRCDVCNRWFHSLCAGIMGKAEARAIDKFICKSCEPEHGETTYVRTSSRARTAIDYAGLNQGVIKSSVETSLHHYIQPFRTGKFKIQPDDFARVRPELLTAEFFQSFDNMKRPFVVPAAWNPRFGQRSEDTETGTAEKGTDTRIDGNGNRTTETEVIAAANDNEEVIDCDQDHLDMVMPRDLTVRKVANIVGLDYPLPGVIDVKSQETKGVWTLGKWADYYDESGEKPVRNVISLEVSETSLGRVMRRPKVVRDLDLEDHVWPFEQYPDKKKKSVQFYCLMSVADSYTDFHIDFGGSSVYYHILKGTKVFFFIPPEDRYLKKYEEWCNSSTQNDTWLPDLCGGNVTRVDLHEGDTAFIPAGWIHSVWTPEDSLVIGGNFLTKIDYDAQFKVATIEKNTHVAATFRYPFFQKVMWYALIKYLEEDPVPEDVMEDFQEDPDFVFLRANPAWLEIDDLQPTAEPGTADFNYRFYPKSEIKGLPSLRDYLYRTARIASDLPVDNINKKAIDAVKRSVPKEHGDPLVLIKTFAIWCAWKTGGEKAPAWVHDDELEGSEAAKIKKQKAVNHRIPGERTSSRRIAQIEQKSEEQAQEAAVVASQQGETWPGRESTFPSVVTPYKPGASAPGVNSDATKKHKPASTKPTTIRQACDACRKRRVKCRHREGSVPVNGKSSSPRSESPMGDFIPPTNGTGHDDHAAQPADAFSSSLAQAALASMDAPGSDVLLSNNADQSPPSGKKSRSKACDECRKSKVSCESTFFVLDTNGRSADVCTMNTVMSTQPRLQNQRSREVLQAPNDLHDLAMASGALRMLDLTATRRTEAAISAL